MTNRLALVVAVVLGVLSIVLIRRYVQKIEDDHRFQLVPVPALVAARDIPSGTVLGDADVETTEFPSQVMTRMVGDSRIPVDSKATIVNARTINDIKAGQIFQRYHFPDLGPSGRRNDLKSKVTRDRAITIPMDAIRGVAGMLRPNDYIDLIGTITFTDQTGGSVTVTRTLLKNVFIIAVDDKTNPEDVTGRTVYSSLTLRLTPRDCNKLLYCMSKGGMLYATYVPDGAKDQSTGWDTVSPEQLFDEIVGELQQGGGRRPVGGG